MLKVLKIKHVTMFRRRFDQILVADDRNIADYNPCDMCIFKDCPSANCTLIHECVCETAGWNTYWLLGACTAYPDDVEYPNGRGVAP